MYREYQPGKLIGRDPDESCRGPGFNSPSSRMFLMYLYALFSNPITISYILLICQILLFMGHKLKYNIYYLSVSGLKVY